MKKGKERGSCKSGRIAIAGLIVLALGMSTAVVLANRYEQLSVGELAVETSMSGAVINNANISPTAAIAHSKLASVAPGRILVGNASSQAAAVAVSGDVTLATNGAVAIASGVIVNDDVSASAAIASSKLATDVVRSGDTTPKQLIQSGTLNVADTTSQTNTFAVAFKSATTPIVIATYKTTAGDVQPVFITEAVSNRFVAVIAATNMPINWIAIGEKP